MHHNLLQSYADSLNLLKSFIEDEKNIALTAEVAEQLAAAFKSGNKAMICGNGGSACDAMHFAEEFTGRYRKDRPALPVISLTDASHITCVGNDYGFDAIFSRGVEAFGQKGDFFFGISTSGNSPNVLKAIDAAKSRGLKTVALLGKDGGRMKGLCDYEFIVPGKTADRIQEVHMMILHIIIEGVERVMWPELYA